MRRLLAYVAVRVPHDWGIERGFDPMQNGIHEANLDMTGVGWYRKRFRVGIPEGGKVYFACDGAASFAMVLSLVKRKSG